MISSSRFARVTRAMIQRNARGQARVSRRRKEEQGDDAALTVRLPADEMELPVADRLREFLASPQALSESLVDATDELAVGRRLLKHAKEYAASSVEIGSAETRGEREANSLDETAAGVFLTVETTPCCADFGSGRDAVADPKVRGGVRRLVRTRLQNRIPVNREVFRVFRVSDASLHGSVAPQSEAGRQIRGGEMRISPHRNREPNREGAGNDQGKEQASVGVWTECTTCVLTASISFENVGQPVARKVRNRQSRDQLSRPDEQAENVVVRDQIGRSRSER